MSPPNTAAEDRLRSVLQSLADRASAASAARSHTAGDADWQAVVMDAVGAIGTLRGYLMALHELGIEDTVVDPGRASILGTIRENVDVLLMRGGLGRSTPPLSA